MSEISLEKLVLERPLRSIALQARPVQQPVRVEVFQMRLRRAVSKVKPTRLSRPYTRSTSSNGRRGLASAATVG